jgi:hypothetical protein
MPRWEWVEVGDDGRAIRIFKNLKAAAATSIYPNRIGSFLRSIAVGDIRRQIWERAKKKCEHCGKILAYGLMEMHEELWRGRGGEISLANGRCLCVDCHQFDKVAGHGKRQVRFGESS